MRESKADCRINKKYDAVFQFFEHELRAAPASDIGSPTPPVAIWGGVLDVAADMTEILEHLDADLELELEDGRAGTARCLHADMGRETDGDATTLLYVVGLTWLERPSQSKA